MAMMPTRVYSALLHAANFSWRRFSSSASSSFSLRESAKAIWQFVSSRRNSWFTESESIV